MIAAFGGDFSKGIPLLGADGECAAGDLECFYALECGLREINAGVGVDGECVVETINASAGDSKGSSGGVEADVVGEGEGFAFCEIESKVVGALKARGFTDGAELAVLLRGDADVGGGADFKALKVGDRSGAEVDFTSIGEESEDVVLTGSGIEGVLECALLGVEGIVVKAQLNDVIASASIELIGAATGFDEVIAATGCDGVVVAAGLDVIIPVAGVDGIVSPVGVDGVIAGACSDGVVSMAGVDGVVAGARSDGVVAVFAVEFVVAITA